MAVNTAALGTDFYCEDDISDDLAYESDPVLAYVQACFRRVVMLNLFYADPYGVGIFRFILDTGQTAIGDEEIRSAIVTALMLDERTENVLVTFVGPKIRIQVTPSSAPAFKFTLEIDKVSGVIEGTQ